MILTYIHKKTGKRYRLVEVLGAATRWRIEGERMWLLDGAGSELAEFRAVYF